MGRNDMLLALVGGTCILMFFALSIILFLIAHKKKRYRHLLEKQQMENVYENQLLQSKLEVQEQSFRHFSEEIHDNVGQLLSIVKMQLYGIGNISKEEKTVSKVSECTEILGKAINELRNISHTLNSSYINSVGLLAAIEKELEYIRSAKDVDCALQVSGDDHSFGDERELLVFRILQEAIGNAVKHSDPTSLTVMLCYEAESLEVSIKDDGKGFDTTLKSAGIGLGNMAIRAALLNGSLHISSVKGSGTVIKLTMPLQPMI